MKTARTNSRNDLGGADVINIISITQPIYFFEMNFTSELRGMIGVGGGW